MLDTLKIAGIRSFPPDTPSSIGFNSKLTLLTGHNGAGKTTIIECLKFATSGNFPPGSENGKSFIHDPRLVQKTDVHASVKLTFRSISGEKVKSARLLRLIKKQSDTFELRKAENLIEIASHNGPVSKSLKVGEMDTLIPEYLGLSQAMLNYVNFCHQEDSLWPFSESGKLKHVLDQIFSTNLLSKALDTQKKFVAKEETKLKTKQKELTWAMDMLEKNRNDIAQHRKVREEILVLSEEKCAAKQQLDQAKVILDELEKLSRLINYKKIEENKLEGLENELLEFDEDDFNQRILKLEEAKAQLEAKISEEKYKAKGSDKMVIDLLSYLRDVAKIDPAITDLPFKEYNDFLKNKVRILKEEEARMESQLSVHKMNLEQSNKIRYKIAELEKNRMVLSEKLQEYKDLGDLDDIIEELSNVVKQNQYRSILERAYDSNHCPICQREITQQKYLIEARLTMLNRFSNAEESLLVAKELSEVYRKIEIFKVELEKIPLDCAEHLPETIKSIHDGIKLMKKLKEKTENIMNSKIFSSIENWTFQDFIEASAEERSEDYLKALKHEYQNIEHSIMSASLQCEKEKERYHKNLAKVGEIRQTIQSFADRIGYFSDEELETVKATEKTYSEKFWEISGKLKSKSEEESYLSKSIEVNTESKVSKLYIETEVLTLAIQEQKTLLAALESSITEFHQTKIEQINRILCNLWHKMYKGTDIDHIFLKADSEKKGEKTAYNYRLCFACKDTELDMRGRCSAGQKMIASIAIRIALAQAFSVGCVSIVLDEPTTNMDHANSLGLSEALSTLANDHVQLIIITHDEEFTSEVLRAASSASHYLVQKSKGNSVILNTKNF